MEMIGIWVALTGILMTLVALYFYCSCKDLTDKKDSVIGFFVYFGCGLIVAGGVRLFLVT